MFGLAVIPGPEKESMRELAAWTSALHPALPDLGVASRSMMISRDLLHFRTSPTGVLHLCIEHGLYSNLSASHVPAHLPEPSAGSMMNFWRFCVPPSQCFVQAVHFVHSLSSQSFSHAST